MTTGSTRARTTSPTTARTAASATALTPGPTMARGTGPTPAVPTGPTMTRGTGPTPALPTGPTMTRSTGPTAALTTSPTTTPTSAGGHCRVTVVAPTSRVDVALPEDAPLAELLPEILRLVGGPAGVFGATSWADHPPSRGRMPYGPTTHGLTGHVLTGRDGIILDAARTLAEQGVLHGDLLRLRAVDDLPEAPVHDDVVDAVAEAVLAGSRTWTADALRAATLAVVSLHLALAAVVLWFAGARFPGSFHGRTAVIAGAAALFLVTFGIWRARYDGEPGSRGSYYGDPSHARRSWNSWNSFTPSPSSGAHSRRAAPHRSPSHSTAAPARSSRHSQVTLALGSFLCSWGRVA